MDQKSDNDWVRLTSTDGFSFMVKRKVATASGTFKNMLSVESQPSFYYTTIFWLAMSLGNFSEALSNTCATQERHDFTRTLRPWLI